jgi:hypothetical protein
VNNNIFDFVQAFVQRRCNDIVCSLISREDCIFVLVETESKRCGYTLTKSGMTYGGSLDITPAQIVLPQDLPYSDRELIARIFHFHDNAGSYIMEREGHIPRDKIYIDYTLRDHWNKDRKFSDIYPHKPLPEKKKKFTIKGHDDQLISAAAKAIYPECDFILVAGGNTEIGMHRDATFAHADAMTINLGGQAYFDHEDNGATRLEHGDITKFNCKRLHGVLEADLDRIVIAMWQRNPKWV